MPKPRLSDYHLLTTTKVASQLGISPFQLKSWIQAELLDRPTLTRRDRNKEPLIYLFSKEWVDKNLKTVNQILGKENG